MPRLELTDEQVLDLVKQLGPEQQQRIYEYLSAQQRPSWDESAPYFEEHARQAAAERWRDWKSQPEDDKTS